MSSKRGASAALPSDIEAYLDGLDIESWSYALIDCGGQFGLRFQWPDGMRHAVRAKMPMHLPAIKHAAEALLEWRQAKVSV